MPLTPTATRDLLASLGHVPKRFLGQNFLVDGNIVRKSVELAGIAPGSAVVEVGPGLGTLTRALLETGADLWAVEKDEALYAYLNEKLKPEFPERLHLMEGDAVETPLAGLPPERAKAGYKIVANLPYAISTPWMDAVLEGELPERMVLMLQKEAADRYAASNGGKNFGAISVFLQAAFDLAPGHKVSAACFHPRPQIDSYLMHLVRKQEPFIFPKNIKTLIRACFQQRRKQIGSLLRDKLPDSGAAWLARLAESGVTAQARPEQLSWQQWSLLAGCYAQG
jgi:16S rRNA (adenine1518-N6/adenine1519-N6)-dimethyltransferase